MLFSEVKLRYSHPKILDTEAKKTASTPTNNLVSLRQGILTNPQWCTQVLNRIPSHPTEWFINLATHQFHLWWRIWLTNSYLITIIIRHKTTKSAICSFHALIGRPRSNNANIAKRNRPFMKNKVSVHLQQPKECPNFLISSVAKLNLQKILISLNNSMWIL